MMRISASDRDGSEIIVFSGSRDRRDAAWDSRVVVKMSARRPGPGQPTLAGHGSRGSRTDRRVEDVTDHVTRLCQPLQVWIPRIFGDIASSCRQRRGEDDADRGALLRSARDHRHEPGAAGGQRHRHHVHVLGADSEEAHGEAGPSAVRAKAFPHRTRPGGVSAGVPPTATARWMKRSRMGELLGALGASCARCCLSTGARAAPSTGSPRSAGRGAVASRWRVGCRGNGAEVDRRDRRGVASLPPAGWKRGGCGAEPPR